MAAPSLAGFKARMDGAGSTLGWWKGSLPMAGGGTGWSVRSPPGPNHPVNLQWDACCLELLGTAGAACCCRWGAEHCTRSSFSFESAGRTEHPGGQGCEFSVARLALP